MEMFHGVKVGTSKPNVGVAVSSMRGMSAQSSNNTKKSSTRR